MGDSDVDRLPKEQLSAGSSWGLIPRMVPVGGLRPLLSRFHVSLPDCGLLACYSCFLRHTMLNGFNEIPV